MYSLLDVPDKYWQGSYFYLPRTNAIKVRMDTGVQQPKVMQNALYISGQFSGKKTTYVFHFQPKYTRIFSHY